MYEDLKNDCRIIFQYLNCNSEYDEKSQRYNDIYELDDIRWDIGNMWDNGYSMCIPYEGNIPKKIVDKLYEDNKFFFIEDQESNKDIIMTDLQSFTKFMVEYHNDRNKTNIKVEDVYNYYIDKYYAFYSTEGEIDINYLAQEANSYYRAKMNHCIEDIDFDIDEVLEEIDGRYTNFCPGEGNYEYRKTPFYEETFNKDTGTYYVEYKLMSRHLKDYSIKKVYRMNQDDITDEINDLCTVLPLKPYDKDNCHMLKMIHECQAAPGGIHTKQMYKRGKANSIVIYLGEEKDYGSKLNDNQIIIYNLNTHKIQIIGNDHNKVGIKAKTKQKQALYNLLNAIKEKLNEDLKEHSYQKRI